MIGSSSNSKKDGGKRKGSGGKKGNLLVLDQLLCHSIYVNTKPFFINRWLQEEKEKLAGNPKPFDVLFLLTFFLFSFYRIV